MPKKKPSILVIGAHNDDFAIGVGGSLLKYINEGYEIYSLVASFGEQSHPHLKPQIIAKERVKEAQRVCDFMGIKKLEFIGAKEGKFLKEDNPKIIHNKIKDIICKIKPEKIFTHSIDDPHPDHRALYKITLDVAEEIEFDEEIYMYDIWNPVSFKSDQLKMVVDISPFFIKKIKSIRMFSTQWVAILQLIPIAIIKGIRNGLTNKCRFAEVFYRVR